MPPWPPWPRSLPEPNRQAPDRQPGNLKPGGTEPATGKPEPANAEPAPGRQQLVRQARRHGVRDPAVLDVMARVPREEFVPRRWARHAFDDRPLPIGGGQTISQPAMVALMSEAARLGSADRVLEVGTGSGYGAAVLAELAARVVTVERLEPLARQARAALDRLGYADVEVVVGDGTLGWAATAPYDAIVVTAAGPAPPPALVAQLVDGGKLVMPVGARDGSQILARFTRSGDEMDAEELFGVRFVPLIGEQGFGPADP